MVRAAMTAPALSVIIPTLNEAGQIGNVLHDLRSLSVSHEVIVADGGSTDTTVAIARTAGAKVITAPRGRGGQLRAGVAASRAAMLCVLHADVRVPDETRRAIDGLTRGAARGAWAFRLSIASNAASYRMVELGARLRSRVLALPYGDQGLVVHRATYAAAGGYADVPLMEDVILARALRPVGGIRLRPEPVVASARRWERDGVFHRSLANLTMLARFLAGATPEQLASRYRPAP